MSESDRIFGIKKKFLREKDYNGLREFLDEAYGVGTVRRHVAECQVMWEEGRRDEAIDEIVYKLRGDSYSVMHIILASEYALKLRRLDVADFLEFSFKSKFLEKSSILAAKFVYRELNGIESSEDMKDAARTLLMP
ncbi:hypothetical protein [Mesorhizobium sp. 113-3-3]|uniref:hypothetical protein n=1 Tax=Mesorhizobium sp. 113-3-3 TaxID=2744516 RepID=UPI00192886DD|nr:hypothetical protein [Mesorhizobium sp. 113-3-3]BCG80468.1 hypothetical protein MesoLj113b_40100 [Mesorhizobium sp. 113-3-3]